MLKRNQLWFVVLAIVSCLWAGTPAKVENVIVVVVDGVRYQEGVGTLDSKNSKDWSFANIGKLRSQGTIIDTYYVGNPNKITETNPDHAIMLTGTWQELYNDMSGYKRVHPGEDLSLAQPEGKYIPDRPTLFEYYRKENNVPSTSVALVVGKEKLKVMAYSTHPEYGETYGAYTWNIKDSYASFSDETYTRNFLLDNVVALKMNEIIDQYHPKLMMVNLPLVDYIGHKEITGNAPYETPAPSDPTKTGIQLYRESIQNADRLIGELWDKIQSDDVYKDKTVLIVVSDHGRHDDNCADHLTNHDGLQCTQANDPLQIGTCTGVQHITFFAIGPDIKKGFESHTPRTLRDLAPTIAQLMHFAVPYAEGNIMDEILVPGVTKNYVVDKGHAYNVVNVQKKYQSVGVALDSDWKNIIPLIKTDTGWMATVDVANSTAFKFVCGSTWFGDGNSLGKADGVIDTTLPTGEKAWKIYLHKESNTQQVRIWLDDVTGKYTVTNI